MGEGLRPYRPGCAGDPGADRLERREDAATDLSTALSSGGGNIAALVMGVLATDVEGVSCCCWLLLCPWLELEELGGTGNTPAIPFSSRVCSEKLVTTLSASLAVDMRRAILGRGVRVGRV